MDTGTGERTEAPSTPAVPAAPPRPARLRRLASFPVHPPGSAEPPRLLRRFCRDLIRGMVVVALLHIFILQISVVRGHSMQPCLTDGDRLVVDCILYSFADVERFDVVVMRNPSNESVDYVKRIVGLPGDRVCLRSGRLSVNGNLVDELFAPIVDYSTTEVVKVPEGHFFVLGDNRPISCDSRDFGLVRQDLLKGKVRLRFWPIDRFRVF